MVSPKFAINLIKTSTTLYGKRHGGVDAENKSSIWTITKILRSRNDRQNSINHANATESWCSILAYDVDALKSFSTDLVSFVLLRRKICILKFPLFFSASEQLRLNN